jgi:hypothetical protein
VNDGRMLDDEAAESLRLYALIVRDARATERRHCIKVLADLRDDNRSQVGKQWLATAIAALSEAATPVPVASSPVGGEQQ